MDIVYTNLHTHNKHVDNHNGIWIPASDFIRYNNEVVPGSHETPCVIFVDAAAILVISSAVVMNPNFFNNYGILTGDFLFRAILCTQTNTAAGDIMMGQDLTNFALGTDIESATAYTYARIAVPASGAAESFIFHDDRLAVADAEVANIEGTIFEYTRNGTHVEDTYTGEIYFLGVLIGWRGEL